MSDLILGLVLGLVAGLFAAYLLTLLEPVQRRLAGRGRKMFRDKGIQIHVESDPAIIWAGFPDWIAFFFFVPNFDISLSPPTSPRSWRNWAANQGGWDLGRQTVRLTLIGTSPATIVLETPEVTAVRDKIPQGIRIAHRTGGADINPRAYNVDLDTFGVENPLVALTEAGGAPAILLSVSLQTNEAQQILLHVSSTSPSLIHWRVRLPIIVDGRRQFLKIDDQGKSFTFAGGEQLDALVWGGVNWVQP